MDGWGGSGEMAAAAGRLLAAAADVLGQVVEEGVLRGEGAGVLARLLDDPVDEEAEAVAVLLGEAQHVGDDPHGDVLRVGPGGVDHVDAGPPCEVPPSTSARTRSGNRIAISCATIPPIDRP